jgi:hypothetical protein
MDKNPTKTREKLRKQRKTPCFLNKNTVFNWQGHKDLNYPTLVFSLTIVNHTVPKGGVFRTNNGVF